MVICDTSGRLHTNDNLMQELLKCKRALGAPSQQTASAVTLFFAGTKALHVLGMPARCSMLTICMSLAAEGLYLPGIWLQIAAK